MTMPDPSSDKLILPPDGRQTRIDFFKSNRSSEPDDHITFARRGSREFWNTITAWFRSDESKHEELLYRFHEILEEKGYSKKSCKSYLFMLRKFFDHYSDRDPVLLSMGEIEDYNYEFFVSGRYSRSYQLQFFNAIKLFYHHLFDVDLNLKPLRKTGTKRY